MVKLILSNWNILSPFRNTVMIRSNPHDKNDYHRQALTITNIVLIIQMYCVF